MSAPRRRLAHPAFQRGVGAQELPRDRGVPFTRPFARSAASAVRAACAAVVSSRWQGHVTYPGGRCNDDQRYSLVLVKVAPAWRVLAEHCTQIQPEAT
ncbi:MAG: hypothetical protein ACJ79S_10235 [Gemmatimonadaceae bacterium]